VASQPNGPNAPNDSLYVIRRFLDEAACRRIRRAMDAGTSEPAEVIAGGIERQDDVRRAASVEVDPATVEDVEGRLDEQRAALAAFFDLALAGREGAGFLRYGPGGFYRPHRDRGASSSWPGAADRRITVVVFLNAAEFTGGVLRVGQSDIAPEAGTLVAFRSETLHEVTSVHGGVRDTVVDWFL
jgi:SM-20-related protein